MRKEIIKNGDSIIKPDDIDVKEHFFGAFGHSETEVSARHIVKLCQQKGGWFPFTKMEIEDLYNKAGREDFWFNRLLDMGYIVLKDNKYHITKEFVENCYKSSPAK